ncbi:ABC transporter permease [Echinicola vietnamensis]|uniref:ABC-type antimicrobial peptide transport system, permease component n=1 Tax=Echinicola vietnamensis (strain DSM 17526 / LMG 23754 / KMM 6221) TaxID=926556 RepID=L0FZ86_ECHVK|nr:ABC transporter permease [Echinicola vietnamensis]AGA78602.1 ABC-type antimicrobial peptide transport system, permease component [Echinicola vietnamensis DSM 17526]
MELLENIKEALRSIKSNRLRTILTGLIIAIGITALVGMLTAIDGMKAQIEESFSGLGANNFDVRSKNTSGQRVTRSGVTEKQFKPVSYKDALDFRKGYSSRGMATVSTRVSGSTEVKRGSEITNPNVRIIGVDENYVLIKGQNIEEGRNFSNVEIEYGNNVCLIGSEIVELLFKSHENPVGAYVSFFGNRYSIVGVLEEQGSVGNDSGVDRTILIPVENASRLDQTGGFWYTITVSTSDPTKMEYEMGQATGLMRKVREDRVGELDSFEVVKSNNVGESLEEVAGYLRIGGFGIGFITLLGASVGLMNIMLVSVTERTREIGIRKALGATPKRIRQQFLIEAIVICIMGGVFGVLVGMGIGNIVASFVGPGGFLVPWLWMLLAFMICVLVGLVSGVIPAIKASKLDPIEALRYE